MTARHVVLVGHGMVGDRFVEEIRRRDPRAAAVRLTVLGAEPRGGYNRILLPGILSGAMREEDIFPNAPGTPPAGHVTFRPGTAATALDVRARAVLTSDGALTRYDALVLATGAVARMPGLPGLDRSVTPLRTLADARRVNSLALRARRKHGRIMVLGGGVLGLEAARALAARGTPVTVIHPAAHLMERQVDAPGGRILAAALRRMGVDVELGARASWWEPAHGLRLTDGRFVRATGMVVCAGVAPDAGLARDAGLRLTEGGAIAVDDTLATSDPAVHAIGDCAGHPGAAVGLVQPGWEQAAVLASRLTGDTRARYRGSTAVTRLKAAGIELTCLGEGLSEGPGNEILRFEDPVRERYAKLVIGGDRVAGAIMIGLPDAAAGLTQLYDRGTPAPADRLALLLGRALPPEAPGAAGPAALPDHAIVCRCNMVTKAALRDAWYRGARGRAELSAATRAATGCGTCGDDLGAFATWMAAADPDAADPAPCRADPAPCRAGPVSCRAGPGPCPSPDPSQQKAVLA